MCIPLGGIELQTTSFLFLGRQAGKAGRAQQDQVQELLSYLQEDFLNTTMPSSSTCYLHSHWQTSSRPVGLSHMEQSDLQA